MKQWVWTAVLLWLVACAATSSERPATQNLPEEVEEQVTATSATFIEVAPQKAEDELTVVVEGDSAVFDITSPSGIGGATVRLAGGAWPEHLVLYLHLKGLEQLRLTYGDVVVTTAVSSLDGSSRQNLNTNSVTEQSIEPDSPYWMKTEVKTADDSPGTIPLENGYFVVELPTDLRDSGKTEFTLEWIDFFR